MELRVEMLRWTLVLVLAGLIGTGCGAAPADRTPSESTGDASGKPDPNAPAHSQPDGDANTPRPRKNAAKKEEGKPSPERIAKLVKQLDGKDLKKVMLAYDELMQAGPSAVRPIYKMARKSRSRDTRIRSVVLIKEILKRAKEKPAPRTVDPNEYSWTQPVAGIAMRLSVDRKTVTPGRLVRLRVDFRNTTDKAATFTPLTYVNTPRGGSSKAEGKLARKQASASKVKPTDFRKRPLTKTLKPGQMVTYRFRINEKLGMQHKVMLMHEAHTRSRTGLPIAEVSTINWLLPKGENQLQFTYYAAGKGLLPDAKKNLSQTVTVTVAEQPNQDVEGDS